MKVLKRFFAQAAKSTASVLCKIYAWPKQSTQTLHGNSRKSVKMAASTESARRTARQKSSHLCGQFLEPRLSSKLQELFNRSPQQHNQIEDCHSSGSPNCVATHPYNGVHQAEPNGRSESDFWCRWLGPTVHFPPFAIRFRLSKNWGLEWNRSPNSACQSTQ